MDATMKYLRIGLLSREITKANLFNIVETGGDPHSAHTATCTRMSYFDLCHLLFYFCYSNYHGL